MLIQALDDKQHCIGIYHEGKLIYDCDEFDLDAVSATWNYSPIFAQKDAVIASLLVGGKSLDEVCPGFLRHRWETINARLKAFYKSFSTAKVSLDKHCFYDLVPQRFLLEYCDIKNQITKHVLENYDKPKNYDFMAGLVALLHRIKDRKLNLKFENLDFKRQALSVLIKSSVRKTDRLALLGLD